MGIRKSTGLVTITLAATPAQMWPTQALRVAKIRKIMAMNNTGGNTAVQIGYVDLAAAFVQVAPDILLLSGIDLEIPEENLPLMGNSPPVGGQAATGVGALGFSADATALTGTDGFIMAQITVAGGTGVQLLFEVEEDE